MSKHTKRYNVVLPVWMAEVFRVSAVMHGARITEFVRQCAIEGLKVKLGDRYFDFALMGDRALAGLPSEPSVGDEHPAGETGSVKPERPQA